MEDITQLKQSRFGAMAVMLASILWSVDGLLRRLLYTLPPTIIVFWEHIIGFVLLIPFIIANRHDLKAFTRKQVVAIALVSLLSGALGTIFYTAALGKVNYIQFSVVVLLQQLNLVFAITAAAIGLKEKITKPFLLYALVAFAAAYFITFPTLRVNLATGSQTIIAALLALGAAACWGSSTALSKYALTKTSFLHTAAIRFALTPIFAFIIALILKQSGLLFTISQTQIYTLVLIALTTGMVALVIYYWGLKRVSVRISAVLELIWPLSAIFIDFFVFHKPLSPTQILGAVVLLFVISRISLLKKSL